MNVYRFTFCAVCPNDQATIVYSVTVESPRTIFVEALNDWRAKATGGFHEDFADQLYEAFGGRQTITARHQGVFVETARP